MTSDVRQAKTDVLCRWINAFKIVHTTYCFYSLYRLWESSASHLLALDQLRHGTSLVNYTKIQFYGLNPEIAVNSAGENAYFKETKPQRKETGDPEKLIYVMKDRAIPCQCNPNQKWRWCENFTITKRTNPFDYAYKAGAVMFAVKGVSPALRSMLMKIGGIIGYLTPILKFHFDPNKLEQFEPDPSLPCLAFRSDQPISTEHLGLLGA